MICIQVAYHAAISYSMHNYRPCVCHFLGSILTIDDLRSVNNKLIKAAGKWKALGIALGLDHSTLNDIEDDYHKNKDCLCEMLAARLNKTDPLITYSDICQSLREPIVRQDAIAKAIEEEFTGVNIVMRLTSTTLYSI